ncbi:MAG: T9SS type A sorting domain-containing protein [Bacteroidaceae bacterium]|nr:T9SS type A sorting domain-containing protein [Bacteroidaceae bacterium]
MRKFTLRGLVLMLSLSMGINASAESIGVKTKAVYSYGAMLDGGYSQLPTGVVRSFYDADNRLARVVEADIMLADSEGTPEVEVPGQEIPKLYSNYEYDAEGRLQKVRTRKYGLYSAFDRAWTDYADAEVYEYDTNGKLVKKTDATYITTYKWEGENLVEETAYYTKDNAWSSTVKYTAFAEGKANLPTSALFSDTWKNQRVYEYAYDENGNKLLFSEYKVKNAETDEIGILVKADKGDLYKQTAWTYADGKLAEEQIGYWNSAKETLDPDSKVTYTVNGDTTSVMTFRYYNEKWSRFGGVKKHVHGVVDNATSATGLTVETVEGALNTVALSADAPAGASADGWNVYRNGMLIGGAILTDGKLTYQDNEVPNGVWDYFFQQADGNASNVVETTLDTELVGVEGVKMLKNSLNATGDYEVIFTWATPNTTLPVLGYNVYVDIQSYETNPAPENGMELIPAELALDTLSWMAAETDMLHDIYVETVYSIGKVRSQAIPLLLQKEEKPLIKKVVMTMGDAMGQAADDAATKAETYYYDTDNKLVRKMIYGKLLAADPDDPDQLYGEGDWIPMTYTAYDYNDKGQLVKTRERQYGVFSGYNKAWNEFEETGSFSYYEDGRIKEDTTTNRVYHYEYERENLVKETYANSRNVIIYHKYFSNFVAGLVNCPQYAFANSPAGLTTNDRIYEYAYDNQGNMVSCRAYKYDNSTIVKDDEGNVIGAEKGTPDYEEIWMYDHGILTKYEKNVWKTKNNAYEASSRIEYTQTPMGTKAVTWKYSVGIWAKGGTPQVTWEVPFNGMAAKDLSIEEVEGKVNTVLLTATKPAGALASTVWNVFRNGVKIGQAKSSGRSSLTYEDANVPNGNWDYFIQAEDAHGPVGVNVSNVVEKTIHTELPAVTNIKVMKNEYNDVQDYELVLKWKSPKTDLTLLGYNVYVDVKDVTKNPSPTNGLHCFTDTTYTFTWANDVNPEKSIIVEAVYNIGKVKSNPLKVTLMKQALPKQVKARITMGDAMGNTSDAQPSKSDVYYYDADNKVVAMVRYGKLLGDDPDDPDKIYSAGDWIPMNYVAYDYNEKGQLVHTRERQYGVFSGYNKAWNDFEETGSFSYFDDGRMKEDTTTNRVYHYEYDGDNLVKETYANSHDVIIYHKYYRDFVEGLANCPQYAFANSPYGLTTNDRIYEYAYDEKGNKTLCRAYKYDNSTIVKDDEGNVINAEKGTPDYEEIWTYEDGDLVKYEKNKWNAGKNAYVGDSRTEYTETELGTMSVTWRYSVGIWAKSGNPQVVMNVPFEGIAASNLTVTDVEGKVNTVLLSAQAPAGTTASTVWNVFRNGVKIGKAKVSRGTLTYEDAEVPNGNWTYFIQAEDTHGAMGVNVSNVVERVIYTELPAVEDISVVSNHYNDVQDYELVLDWEAPVTDLPIKGYNMFVDVKEMTKNPSPVNGLYPFEETTYTYTAANDVNPNKTFMVETVYNIGKVKSEAVAVVLQKEESQGVGSITVANLLMLVNRTLMVNGEYKTLGLYTTDVVEMGTYNGVSRIDLSSLSQGVYVVRVNTADGVLTGKIALK